MITAQDIREKGFERARVNGYDMASVDDFLEELADDVAASQKENAVLKSKMKVLVDKIEEYRANEEALNSAILSAQKLAVQIESEARQRAAATDRRGREEGPGDHRLHLRPRRRRGEAPGRRQGRLRQVLRGRQGPLQHPARQARRHRQRHGLCRPRRRSRPLPPGPPRSQPDVDDTVRAIENSAAQLQTDDPSSSTWPRTRPASVPSSASWRTPSPSPFEFQTR